MAVITSQVHCGKTGWKRSAGWINKLAPRRKCLQRPAQRRLLDPWYDHEQQPFLVFFLFVFGFFATAGVTAGAAAGVTAGFTAGVTACVAPGWYVAPAVNLKGPSMA